MIDTIRRATPVQKAIARGAHLLPNPARSVASSLLCRVPASRAQENNLSLMLESRTTAPATGSSEARILVWAVQVSHVATTDLRCGAKPPCLLRRSSFAIEGAQDRPRLRAARDTERALQGCAPLTFYRTSRANRRAATLPHLSPLRAADCQLFSSANQTNSLPIRSSPRCLLRSIAGGLSRRSTAGTLMASQVPRCKSTFQNRRLRSV